MCCTQWLQIFPSVLPTSRINHTAQNSNVYFWILYTYCFIAIAKILKVLFLFVFFGVIYIYFIECFKHTECDRKLQQYIMRCNSLELCDSSKQGFKNGEK